MPGVQLSPAKMYAVLPKDCFLNSPPTWAPDTWGNQQVRVLLVLVKAESTLRPGLARAAREFKFRWGIPGGWGSTLLFKPRILRAWISSYPPS